MFGYIEEAINKIRENTREGRRTLLLCFYSGHGYTDDHSTFTLLNSNDRGLGRGGNCYDLEHWLGNCAKEKGVYVINLFACDRVELPKEIKEEAKEEAKEEENVKGKGFLKKLFRGGTEATDLRPIEDTGQSITIHSVLSGCPIFPETPSLAQEFL